MLGIRKAGEAIANFDERYANRAYEDLGGEKAPVRAALGGTPLSKMDTDLPEGTHIINRIVSEIMRAGAAGTNLGYRYGLPAAGVTLAGKGLHDMSGNLFALSAEDAEQYAQTFEANGMPEYAASMRASQAGTQGELPM